MKTIYLDYNATTRPLPEVVEAVAEHCRSSFANPGSRHAEGRKARQVLERARESIAGVVGADSGEVIFTSGGTESINMAVLGLTANREGGAPAEPRSASNASARREPRPPGAQPTIALTRGEHPATLESCRHLERQGFRLHFLEVDSGGRLRPEQYDELPWDELRLVTIILAHNETGVIQDIAPLAERCRARGVPLHLDAVQAVGKIPVHFHRLGATALSLGAHKFHGPRGVGGLLLRKGTRLAPIQFGGHHEAGRRPGTEAVPLIAGMATALESWHRDSDERTRRIAALRDRLERGLVEACASTVVNGSREHRLPNTLNIAFPGLDGDALLVAFDLEGLCCSLGSTCASGSAEPAPSLVAMGCPPEVYRSSVRFSVGLENTEEEIDEAARRISAVVRRLRGLGG